AGFFPVKVPHWEKPMGIVPGRRKSGLAPGRWGWIGKPMFRQALILGAPPRVSVSIARSLYYQCGVPVEVAYLSARDPKFTSRAIRASVSLPDFQEAPAEFIETLTSFIRERRFDVLIPVQDGALAAIVQHYDVLSSMLHVACP